jgi:hypothetical protein
MNGRIENGGPGHGRCRPCQSGGTPVENAMRFPPASHRSLEKPADLRSLPFPQGLGKSRGGLVPPRVSHTSHSPDYGYLPRKGGEKKEGLWAMAQARQRTGKGTFLMSGTRGHF